MMRIEPIRGEFWKPEGAAAQSNGTAELPKTLGAAEKGGVTIPDDRSAVDQTADAPPGRKVTEKDIEKLNKTAEAFNKKIHLKIHEETGRVMVKIVNGDTQEVLMELPPEKILDLVAKIEKEMGLILDKRV